MRPNFVALRQKVRQIFALIICTHRKEGKLDQSSPILEVMYSEARTVKFRRVVTTYEVKVNRAFV